MSNKDIRKEKIGLRIKQIRKGLGLTMKEFGEKFDPPASDSIVSRWERGISVPSNERLTSIAELGNISTFYLTTGKKAVADLSDNEKRDMLSLDLQHDINKVIKDQNEYLKKEIENIKINELNFVESTYLVNALNFLKFSDTDDVITLASLIRTLLTAVEVRTDDSVSQEELNDFVDAEIKDIGEFIKKQFFREE